MRLTELKPHWISLDVFTFLCPCCQKTRLLCKRVPMVFQDQVRLVHRYLETTPEDADYWPPDFVPMNAAACWQWQGRDFGSLTVTPSIDASASGHWHGHIRDGAIT